jgi:hypothetical protein
MQNLNAIHRIIKVLDCTYTQTEGIGGGGTFEREGDPKTYCSLASGFFLPQLLYFVCTIYMSKLKYTTREAVNGKRALTLLSTVPLEKLIVVQ